MPVAVSSVGGGGVVVVGVCVVALEVLIAGGAHVAFVPVELLCIQAAHRMYAAHAFEGLAPRTGHLRKKPLGNVFLG